MIRNNAIADMDDLNEFLNTPLEFLYTLTGKFTYQLPNFKSLMLVAVNHIEKAIKGAFNSSLGLENYDMTLLKEMFPYVLSEDTLNIQNDNDIKRLSNILLGMRNINAHFCLGKKDLMFFNEDFSFLKNITPCNGDLIYYKNDITVSGLMFFVACFLRPESILTLTKLDSSFGMITNGRASIDKSKRFSTYVNGVFLENEIRRVKGNTIFTSCLGELEKFCTINDDEFDVTIPSTSGSIYSIKGKFANNEFSIDKHSNTKIYYKKSYQLKIIYDDGFIAKANSLPPFVFLDYLCKRDVHEYTKEVDDEISKDMGLISKLNKPKFYINKNIDIILMGNTNADFRLIAEASNASILQITHVLIRGLGGYKNLTSEYGYRYIELLRQHEFPQKLAFDLNYLHNFAVHDYIINEYIVGPHNIKYTYSLIIRTYSELLKFLKGKYDSICNAVEQTINRGFVSKIILLKYRKIIDSTTKYLEHCTYDNLCDLRKKYSWIENGGFDINIFLPLVENVGPKYRIYKINLEGVDVPLYLKHNASDKGILDKFMQDNNMKIISTEDDQLIEVLNVGK